MNTICENRDRVWAEINLDNLKHNVEVLEGMLPEQCAFMAVVKANAYGHGDIELTKYLNKIGVSAFAVATIDEGIRLRKNGINGEILVLGYTYALRANELYVYDLIQTVTDYRHAEELNDTEFDLNVHLKIDSGMHRLGQDHQNFSEFIHAFFQLEHLNICGIFSHLCVADSKNDEDIEFTKWQFHNFYLILEQIKKMGYHVPKTHIQSSYGVLNYPELNCDYARIGIAMYGVFSTLNSTFKVKGDLYPVMSIKSRIILIREVMPGDSVGYGRAFIAKRKTRIAVVPFGYGDGWPRNLSCGKGRILVNGQAALIVGRICMDQLTVDITDIPSVERGDIVTFIGNDDSRCIRAEEVAESASTITNELLCGLGGRIKRIYHSLERKQGYTCNLKFDEDSENAVECVN